MFEIKDKKVLASAIFQIEIVAPRVAKKAQPGQFIILRVHEQGERIPLTIKDSDHEKGTVTIVVQVAGKTTQMLSEKEIGDTIQDFVGPLGNPTELPEGEAKVACIGGGVGTACMFPQVKELKQRGCDVTVIIGARTKELLIMEDELGELANRLIVCTDDGSYGEKGFVSDALIKLLKAGETFDLVIAIGPLMMMRAVANVTEGYGIHTIVSLNPIMVDGTGMCGGCRVTVGGEVKFACVDGPEFDAHKVDFKELFMRQRYYMDEEKLAKEQHECKLPLK
ncbi:sulfide/dihydroorotate dehydrogenase-like FAD/NAD-binding protein [Candidatus Poribacteria bacterium]|nr:sulfide/dihydroorotate dehydrogenase-like FAD/NAD-binding protein [Candidatus Poribacteria bacterium]